MIQDVVLPIVLMLILLGGVRLVTRTIANFFFHRTLREAMRHDKDSVPKLLAVLDAQREDSGVIGWLLIAFAVATGALGLFEPASFKGAVAVALFPALLGITFIAYRHRTKRKGGTSE